MALTRGKSSFKSKSKKKISYTGHARDFQNKKLKEPKANAKVDEKPKGDYNCDICQANFMKVMSQNWFKSCLKVGSGLVKNQILLVFYQFLKIFEYY